MSGHATLSPSGASRWMQCPASVALTDGMQGTAGDDAKYGTDAHELAALCLDTGTDAIDHRGNVMGQGNHADDEMVEGVQRYIDDVRKIADGGTLLVEQRVPLEHITGEFNATGTADAVIVKGDELIIVDLKFGRGVRVDAENNPQLRLYALGAMAMFLSSPFTTVRTIIHQPRLGHVSEEVISAGALSAWGEEARACALTARVALERKRNGDVQMPEHFGPSEKSCRWCKVKATCPALAAKVQADVGADFEDLTKDPDVRIGLTLHVPSFNDVDLSVAMQATDLIEDWIKAVRAEVERRLLAGTEVPGFKLVEGRRGARSWTDEQAAEDMLRKQFRLTIEEAYNLKLISPTQAEKVLKESPKRWAKVQALIAQSTGKPSVAPASDKRPALVVTPTADDFGDITNEELV